MTGAPTVVVAGLTARWLAESAARAGWRVLAMDAFGDADTRAASAAWWPVARGLDLDENLFLSALAAARREHGAQAWVYGGGFEALPDLVAQAQALLPLWGAPAAVLRRVRDPRAFFGELQCAGLPHPPTRFDAPALPAGWLAKSASGSGGWHIRPAGSQDTPRDAYWQRQVPGTPMSALFLADGQRAVTVALNRLLVEPLAALPFVYRGAIGPLTLPALQARVHEVLAALVPAFGLAGLMSLDFIADSSGGLQVLELNPRPSASMALHDPAWLGGLLAAHAEAVQGRLPEPPPQPPVALRGERVVWADRDRAVTPGWSRHLGALGWVHDRPAAGARIAAGQPLCSVSAIGVTADAVLAALRQRQSELLAAWPAAAMQDTAIEENT